MNKLKHEFGYGKDMPINKIKIEDLTDLKLYITDILENAFVADVEENVICFKSGEKVKIDFAILKS